MESHKSAAAGVKADKPACFRQRQPGGELRDQVLAIRRAQVSALRQQLGTPRANPFETICHAVAQIILCQLGFQFVKRDMGGNGDVWRGGRVSALAAVSCQRAERF